MLQSDVARPESWGTWGAIMALKAEDGIWLCWNNGHHRFERFGNDNQFAKEIINQIRAHTMVVRISDANTSFGQKKWTKAIHPESGALM